MSLWMACVTPVAVGLLTLALGWTGPVVANPLAYPEFAQHQVDPAIPITFMSAERVKAQLDAGRPQMSVDVRSREEFDTGHLPRATSIPLGVLSVRMAEIPRDIPVVLY